MPYFWGRSTLSRGWIFAWSYPMKGKAVWVSTFDSLPQVIPIKEYPLVPIDPVAAIIRDSLSGATSIRESQKAPRWGHDTNVRIHLKPNGIVIFVYSIGSELINPTLVSSQVRHWELVVTLRVTMSPCF